MVSEPNGPERPTENPYRESSQAPISQIIKHHIKIIYILLCAVTLV